MDQKCRVPTLQDRSIGPVFMVHMIFETFLTQTYHGVT